MDTLGIEGLMKFIIIMRSPYIKPLHKMVQNGAGD